MGRPQLGGLVTRNTCYFGIVDQHAITVDYKSADPSSSGVSPSTSLAGWIRRMPTFSSRAM